MFMAAWNRASLAGFLHPVCKQHTVIPTVPLPDFGLASPPPSTECVSRIEVICLIAYPFLHRSGGILQLLVF